MTLYDVPADITGSIVAGGSAVTVTTTTPGQNAQLTFTGTASQRVFLKVTGVSLSGGTNNWVTVSITKPDVIDSGGGYIDTQTLPVNGTYTVVADPTNSSAVVRLIRPDGTTQISNSTSNATFNLSQQNLTVNGTYKVVIDPLGTAFGSVSVRVTNP